MPVLILLWGIVACGSSRGGADGSAGIDPADGTGGISTDSAATTATSRADEADPIFDVGGGMATGGDEGGGAVCPPLPPGDTTLTGTVYAPNGEIPVSGALVYLAQDEPAGIPQQVYCSECVELPCGARHTFTEPDGSFSLEADLGSKYLVVQKGQFMRVSSIDVAGEVMLSTELTTLPGVNDPDAGLYIPKIALAVGRHDSLQHALGKLGLGDIYDGTIWPGSQQFDMYLNGQFFQDVEAEFTDLLQDYEEMSKYHIIFVPCTDDLQEQQFTPEVVENIRRWVEAGGKWYVADWSAEYVEDLFPQYQTFFGEPQAIEQDPYDTVGTVLDPELLAWLQALPDDLKDINPLNPDAPEPLPKMDALPQVELVDNWSGVEAVHPVEVMDANGDLVDVGHHVWVEGPGGGSVPGGIHPMSVTGEYGCGRVMFTTYHTVQAGFDYVGLTPQELILMYLILEIGVCQVPADPPPPVG